MNTRFRGRTTTAIMIVACLLLLCSCGRESQGVIDWAVGPVKLTLNADGSIEISGQKSWVTPLGTFSVGEKYEGEAADSEIILVVRHRQGGSIVDDAYKVPTSADVLIVVNGTTQLGIRGRTITLDASRGDIRQISLSGVTWLMPDLAEMNLHTAQKQLEDMSDNAFSYTSVYDATGRGRTPRLDMNWKVCTQSIPPRRTVTADSVVGLGVVKSKESCPSSTSAPTSAVWTMPVLVNMPLDEAEDVLADLSSDQLEMINTHDASGAGRGRIADSGWKVCSQRPAAGSTITAMTPLEFGVIDEDVPCPATSF